MTIKAHFDGKVFVPDEPPDLEKDQKVELVVQPVAGESKKYMTGRELAESEIVGMWADRTDITDSTEYVTQLRRRLERREL